MVATAIDSSGGYEVHFGLREPPFSLTPNPRYVFESRAHRVALEHITAGFRREGFTIVTGEVGTGKTMLCRVVAEQRDPRVFLAILTKLPATADELLRHLLVEFGVIARGNPRLAGAGRFELLNSLEQFLASLVPLGVRAVAIIDDAHRLAQEVLEEIRVVSDLQVESHRLLHIVLIGQPELDALLGRAEQRSLMQRVTSRHSLGPLGADEVSGYVERRMQIAAGNLTAQALFEPSAMRAAAELSRGVPRVINVLCERALESACTSQSKRVGSAAVLAAARNLQLRPPTSLRYAVTRRLLALAAAVVVLGAAGAAGWRSVRAVPGPKPTGLAVLQATPLTIVTVPVPLPASEAASLLVTDAAPSVPLPLVDSYTIVAGSFQTSRRATALAEDLAQLGLPAFVRTTPSGFEQTVVGPFASREEAVAARARLAAAGQTDVLLVPSVRSGARLPSEVPRPSTGERARASATPPDALQRATALALKPDVKALLQLRKLIAEGGLTAGSRSDESQPDESRTDESNALLAKVDALIDEARRRQLEIDRDALTGADPKKTQ
jgi:type II secretory pathway predicted ATPase ExeA/cell division septation protein DedD